MLRSDLHGYSYAYILITGVVTVEGANNRDKKSRSFAYKNNAPFIYCISKVNGVLIENLEDLDIGMPMYNLTEYSENYRKNIGRLWTITKMNRIILLLMNTIQTL